MRRIASFGRGKSLGKKLLYFNNLEKMFSDHIVVFFGSNLSQSQQDGQFFNAYFVICFYKL